MPGSRVIWSVLSAVATVFLAVCLYVGLCLGGLGTRAAIGEARSAWSDSVHVEYHDHGAGETVVLLASLARPASDWNELAAALARAGYRTLAVESRGIGNTDGGGPFQALTLHDLARDVDAVLSASAPHAGDRVHVIGHAFGNRVARTFATDFPSRVRSVTLVAAGGREPIPPEIERALLFSTLSFLPEATHEQALRIAFFAPPSAIPDHWRMGWWLWGGMAQIAAAQSTPSDEFWAGGEAPMLVVQAEDDTIAPPQDAGLPLKFEFPDRVTLVGVPDAGHALLPEQPARIESAVLGFLAQHRDR